MQAAHVRALLMLLQRSEQLTGKSDTEIDLVIEKLNALAEVTDELELEQAIIAIDVDVVALTRGRQPPPQSILGLLISEVERYRNIKAALIKGDSAAIGLETVSIGCKKYRVASGYWLIEDAPAEAIKSVDPD